MSNRINIQNKRARFEYAIEDTYNAGMQLVGSEIKSIRAGKASIAEAFCTFVGDELVIRNMHIAEYMEASYTNHQIRRDRKLLLNRIELDKLSKKVRTKGYTIVPIKVFIADNGYAKIHIGIGSGKKLHDKRHDLKEKDIKRDMDRARRDY